MNYSVRAVSSLEKCFFNDDILEKEEIHLLSGLKNEKINFQIAYTLCSNELKDKKPCFFKIESKLEAFVNVYKIESVPCRFPKYHNNPENNYQKSEPYCYPDLLDPYDKKDNIYFVPNLLQSLFLEIDLAKNIELHGIFEMRCVFLDSEHKIVAQTSIKIEIINANLSNEDISYTQWFHGDCLASYYNVKPLSAKHFKIMENFLNTAREYGINTILTPVLTPPLDTLIGGERPTMQLVEIKKTNNGYEYSYNLLDKWIKMCRRCGFERFEISHFFTQWGAKHAPKVMATVNGKYTKIFGWETDSISEEFTFFLRDFIKHLLNHLKILGIDKQCIFHISDEPNDSNISNYKAAKDSIIDLLDGYLVTDALSSIEYYKNGIVDNPIPSTNHIEGFLDLDVKNLWTYYCCGQYEKVSNRFIAMPSYRNRIIGVQLYKYHIKGFLHWGYNFYYNQYSRKLLNPFLITDGDFFAPAGDAYSVYPGQDFKPLKSLRLIIFNEALQDILAFKTLEKLSSYEYVISIIENDYKNISFKDYPKGNEYLINLRQKINYAIKELI